MENREEMTREVPSLDDEGVPDQLDPLPDKRMAGDGQEGLPPPTDRPTASVAHGTTEREQREGEPLGRRLAQEQPDATRPGDWGDDTDVGRLVEPLGEVDETDVEGESFASEMPEDTFGRSAEEAAMHIDEPR